MKKKQLTKLRLQLEKLVLDLELVEAEADKPNELVCIPDPILVALHNTVRDIETWRGV